MITRCLCRGSRAGLARFASPLGPPAPRFPGAGAAAPCSGAPLGGADVAPFFFARSTVILRPPSSEPFCSWTARCASSASTKPTKPKPRLSLVLRSRTTHASRTGPTEPKCCSSAWSVVSKARLRTKTDDGAAIEAAARRRESSRVGRVSVATRSRLQELQFLFSSPFANETSSFFSGPPGSRSHQHHRAPGDLRTVGEITWGYVQK